MFLTRRSSRACRERVLRDAIMSITRRPVTGPSESSRRRSRVDALDFVDDEAHTAAANHDGTWILVLIRDEAGRLRVEKSMQSRARVVAVATTRAAEQSIANARSRPVVAVVSATDAQGRNCLPLVRRLTQLRPTVPVIGYCTQVAAASRDVLTLARAGVHDVMFGGIDDHGRAVRRFVDTAAQASGVDDILRAIAPGLNDTLLPFVRYCLEHPHVNSVAHAADALGIHRKTLFVHCREASAPPPGIIMTWCRLLLAAHLLATSLRSVEAVALDLGFASATALRNVTKRYTGLRPTAFRDGSAMPMVTQAFLAVARAATAPTA
jgi:AraC-like DNA-binding protein